MTVVIDAVVFDLGGVLIDWDPRHLYRTLFDDDEIAMERFLTEVCSPAWNVQQDAGRSWSEAVETLTHRHPGHRELIAAYDERWSEMLGGAIEGTVEILDELRASGVRVAALSNWSAEKFPVARSRFEFLDWFEAIVISGEVGVSKPDERIYRHLLGRMGLDPGSTVFIDDSAANVAAAAELGMTALRFRDPPTLRAELQDLGLLPMAAAGWPAAG